VRVDVICSVLECRRKPPKSHVKHGPHQQGQRTAFELVGDKELHNTGMRSSRPKIPTIFEHLEWPFQILHQDLQILAIEYHARQEALVHKLVRNRHARHEYIDSFRLRYSRADFQISAQGDELRVLLDVRNEIKHVRS
jgi:hypothetical protein